MRFSKNLMCVGAGLLLTACGSGGGDGDALQGGTYANEVVVRVEFQNLTAFQNVAAVDGDYSDVRFTFDMDELNTVNEGDISFYFNREYTETGFIEFAEVQQHDGDRFVEIPDVEGTYSLQGNTLEWVVDRAELNALLEGAEFPLNADRQVYVVANKNVSDSETTDYIPAFATFSETDDSGRITDVQNDQTPPNGTSAVDLRSVRVLFF